jgi:hypothetical protein
MSRDFQTDIALAPKQMPFKLSDGFILQSHQAVCFYAHLYSGL